MTEAMEPTSPNGASPLDHHRPPAPARRPWAVGEIAAWTIILTVVALIAWRATAAQMRQAAASEPEMMLPMMAQYATGMHTLLAAAGGAKMDAELLDELDRYAKVPADRLRVALVAGEFLGPDEALKRLDALGREDAALAEDVRTAEAGYRGADVPAETRAAFHERYQWFAELLDSTGKPAGDPQRERTLRQAYLTVAVLAGCFLGGALLTVAGLVLLIIVLVRLSRRRIKPAFSRADMPGGSEPADRRTYIYGVAIYLGGYVALGLALRLVFGDRMAWGIVALTTAFALGVICPLLLGQTGVQWRRTLGLHRGRGVWREIGGGIVGYLAGMPLMAAGMALVLLLTKISGIKGAHPIVQELKGGPWELAGVFFLACVFAPVTEELMFRGALFAHLRERFGWGLAAPVMAVIFALIHPQSWVALPVLGAIAVVFAGIREWRGSIIGCMTAHALHNGVMLAVSVLLLR